MLIFSSTGYSQEEEKRVPRNHFMAKFKDVEITDFLKTMSRITKKNILLDDTIRGKITIVSYKFIPVSQAMTFLKQVLETKGYTVIENKNFIKVVKAAEANTEVIPQKKNPGDNTSGIITRVLKIPAGTKPQTLVSLLRPLVGKDTQLSPYEPTNSLVISGFAQPVRRAIRILDELGMKAEEDEEEVTEESAGNIHLYRVRHMEAETLAQVLIRLDNPQAAPPPGRAPQQTPKSKSKRPDARSVPSQRGNTQLRNRPGAKIKAVSHKESNTLIVTADPAEWIEIKKIIKRLDTRRKQMLLEVLIVEVNNKNVNDFGIDWRYNGTDGPHTQFNSGLAFDGNIISKETGQFSGINTLSGFSLGFMESSGEMMGIFNANVRNDNFNVLSAPQILTVDNQEAEISVGQQVPVQTLSSTSGTSDKTQNSYDFRDTGILLKFTPHINPDGIISMDLTQEVTNIKGGESSAINPTFNTRKIKTYVTVKNKQTIVIGGLISSERVHGVVKIPLLGDIPILGHLFRRTTYINERKNLMIFLTPHLLNNKVEADRITEFKRAEQVQIMRERSNEIKLFPESTVPTGQEEDFEEINSP